MSANDVGHPSRTEIDRRARLVLLVLLLGQAMAALDTSIVNVAAPAIQRGLGASGAALQLAVAAYLLTYAVLLMTGARLGTVHGYTRVFVFGAALFTVASGLCGLAPNAEVLVAARAAQGVGAAAMVPQVLSLIQVLFRGAARSRAVGLHSLMLGAGVAVGQVLGGVLVDVDLGRHGSTRRGVSSTCATSNPTTTSTALSCIRTRARPGTPRKASFAGRARSVRGGRPAGACCS